MKKSISVILGVSLIGVGGYFYFLTEPSVVETALIDEVYLEPDREQKGEVGWKIPEPDEVFPEGGMSEQSQSNQEISPVELQKVTEAATVLREELDSLIVEFDANLYDVQTRKEMKQKIDAKLLEYNEMVLPVAMNAMKYSAQKTD